MRGIEVKPSDPAVSRQPTPGRIIPRELGHLGQAYSDQGVEALEHLAATRGEVAAADAACGFADAYARFAVDHPTAFD